MWCVASLCSAWATCPGYVPFQFLTHPGVFAEQQRKGREEIVGAVQVLLGNSQNTGVLPVQF